MTPIIISCALSALALAGLIVFICKSRSKASDNMKQTKDNNKVVANGKEQNKVKEQTTNVAKEEKTVVNGKEQNKEKEVGQGKTVVREEVTVVKEEKQDKVKEPEKVATVVKEEKAIVKDEKQNNNKEDGQGKIIVKVDEENMKKDLGPEINSAIDYLAELKGMGSKEDMMTAFKNFKNVDAKTQDAYLKGLEGVINGNKLLLDSGFDMKTYGLSYDEKLKNLNSLKQYLLNNK